MYNVKDSDVRGSFKNLHNATDGQFGRIWSYHCKDHAIDECFKPGFWASLRNNLMAGDFIRLVRIIKDSAVAHCEGVVIKVTDKDVDFRMASPAVIYWSDREDFKEKKEEIKKETPPAYIKGEGKIKYNVGLGVFEIRVDDTIVAEAADKDTAERIVRGDLPITVMKNRGLGDEETEPPSFREPKEKFEHHQV